MYVIDGFFIFFGDDVDFNLLGDLNLSDIEFIEIFKDVLVIFVYGVEGFNGVIMVMIKRG